MQSMLSDRPFSQVSYGQKMGSFVKFLKKFGTTSHSIRDGVGRLFRGDSIFIMRCGNHGNGVSEDTPGNYCLQCKALIF